MLKRLHLKNFKNFKDAELELGGFTLLVGTNAVGKSNVCDALRFLSAMGRGYTLTEAIGGRYENGVLQWRGIRGWMSEIAFQGGSQFSISLDLDIIGYPTEMMTYAINVDTGIDRTINPSGLPKILSESILSQPMDSVLQKLLDARADLELPTEINNISGALPRQQIQLDSHEQPRLQIEINGKAFLFNTQDKFKHDGRVHGLHHDVSSLDCISDVMRGTSDDLTVNIAALLQGSATTATTLIRNFDWDPRVIRESSLPGYQTIGDRGEGLSSVLNEIFRQPHLTHVKENFIDWLNALTPMDVRDLEFVREESGKIALRIIEANGRKISAASASDGTLRFLAFLAAYFTAYQPQTYFLDELESGIHPTRLHLLIQLIEQQARLEKVQTIATTHSPQILRYLSQDSLHHAYVIHRPDDRSDAQIQRIIDIPHIQEVLETSDLGELLESGWLETTLSFERDEVKAA